ncbi:MAG TPA: phospholipase [Thermoanaerobaculia bacterium]|nr:phospholipase [Thermoanaerobaculia bacterium]
MEVRTVEAVVHGRVLYEHRSDERLLAGFHGYGENAERHILDLQKIPGIESWSVAAIQALHPFYSRRGGGEDIVASWMTRLDRELAIADNVEYIRRALATIWRGTTGGATLVFAGFSQGVAMAYRAAAFAAPADGLIVLAGDVPPDVAAAGAALPPVLVGRGSRDDWYAEERLARDLDTLRPVTEVTVCTFEGGHEWSDEFRNAAGEFLSRFGP